MKPLISLTFAILATSIFFTGCIQNKTTRTFKITRPVYKLKQEVYDNIQTQPATSILTGGKMFLKGNYIFLTEKNKGVHIINNSNPLSPINESFIPIPGTEDVVVKGNILLADCFIDLLSIDISNPSDIKLINIAKNVFPERNTVNGFSIDSSSVIVEWITKDTTTTGEYYTKFMTANGVATLDNFGSSQSPTTTGIAGSMARFVIVNEYLYTVSTSTLRVFDISNASSPITKNNVQMGWNIETIYPLKDKLFIGSQTGMFIYSISNPTNPTQLSTFLHANMCDPVIAEDNYAYITLRSGTNCLGISNQLEIVDITNITNPILKKTYPFTNPHGLSKDGKLLFICDGVDGLKILDATDINDLKTIKTISMAKTYDVIAFNNRAYVAAEDGLYQYDYSDENNIVLLSKISTK
jgi:hypothetical protein